MSAQISSVTISRSDEEEAAHKAKMFSVAKSILGDDVVPSWLPELLSDWSFEVASSHSIELLLPTAATLGEELKSIETGATGVLRALKSPFVAPFLSTNSGVDYEGSLYQMTDFLTKLAFSAQRTRTSLVKRGRGRPHLPGTSSPKYVCAAIIAEVWAQLHGDEPAPTNRRAHAAAAELWSSRIKPAKGWGDEPLKGWTYYFKAVRGSSHQALRAEVRRHFNIRASDAALVMENNAA